MKKSYQILGILLINHRNEFEFVPISKVGKLSVDEEEDEEESEEDEETGIEEALNPIEYKEEAFVEAKKKEPATLGDRLKQYDGTTNKGEA